jgi:hypothetical protein
LGFDVEGEAGSNHHGVKEVQGKVEALEIEVGFEKDGGGGSFRRCEEGTVGRIQSQAGVEAMLGTIRQKDVDGEVERQGEVGMGGEEDGAER